MEMTNNPCRFSYKPFSYTDAVLGFSKKSWQNVTNSKCAFLKKIYITAATILFAQIAALFDLLLTAVCFFASLLGKCSVGCKKALGTDSCLAASQKTITSTSRRPSRPRVRNQHAAADQDLPHPFLTKELIDEALRNPYESRPPITCDQGIIDEPAFLKDAMGRAFERLSLFDPERVDLYRELLENHGVYSSDYKMGNEGVERSVGITYIYWCAQCAVIHQILYTRHSPDKLNMHYAPDFLAPFILPNPTAHRHDKSLTQARQAFLSLARSEQASIVYKIQIPEREWDLTDNARGVLTDIRIIALDLSRNRYFNRNVYGVVYPI